MNLYRFAFHPPQNHKKRPLDAARAAIAATTFLLGMLGSATAGARPLATTTPAHGTLTFTPAVGSLGSVGLESSHSITVTIKNTGTASVTISAESVTGAEFSVTGLTIPKSLAVGASMTVAVKFAPTIAGAASGSLNITSNATNSVAKYVLSGTGVTPELTATPSSVSFGSVPLGTTNSQTIQLKNTSTRSVTIIGASISGAGNHYHLSGLTAPLTLAAGAITHLQVALTPTITGAMNSTLTVNVASPNVPSMIKISGTVIGATRTITATPTSLNFGGEAVGSSHLLTVSLKNTGDSGVTVSGISTSNTAFTTSGGVSGATLAPGQSATLDVSFDPKTATAQSGTVKISSNATNSPLTIVVAGTGVSGATHSVALSWGASSTSGIAGYYLYRSTTAGSGFARLVASPLTALQYTDGSVQSGKTYYYEVTAVNSAGLESASTPEATAVIP
jgi:Cep192 domain 4/HYDIN/CFA65/VesB-like, Ig-like domain